MRKTKIVANPKLPKDIEYPAYIGVLGEPIGKREYSQRDNASAAFLLKLAEKARGILDVIGKLTIVDIDRLSAIAHSSEYPANVRAKAAWEIVAWNTLIRPYTHDSRQYHIHLNTYVSLLEKDAESYFMYLVYILNTPAQTAYRRLKTLHPGIAGQYKDYCRSYEVAARREDIKSLVFNW